MPVPENNDRCMYTQNLNPYRITYLNIKAQTKIHRLRESSIIIKSKLLSLIKIICVRPCLLYWTSNSSLQLWRWITKANSVDFQKVVGVAKALILQIFLCLKYSNVILNQCENEMGGRKSIWYFWERRGGIWWHLIENSSNHNPFDPWTHYTLGKTEYIFLETLQINDENEFDLQMSHFIRILLNFLGLHVSNDHFLEILNNLKDWFSPVCIISCCQGVRAHLWLEYQSWNFCIEDIF